MRHQLTCHHCGTPFQAQRCDARYCSGRCRTAAYRRARKAQRRAYTSAQIRRVFSERRADAETCNT